MGQLAVQYAGSKVAGVGNWFNSLHIKMRLHCGGYSGY
jgi:hypothetical protein